MIRALRALALRAVLCGQIGLALLCMNGAYEYTATGHHPLGRAEAALRWAPDISALLLVWVFAEACMATVAPWRRTLIVLGSLLLMWLAQAAADCAIIRF